MTYELHPLCTLFPRMSGAEFDALKADIRANGLRQPIVLHDEMILDGGNRYAACVEVGIAPVFTHFEGGSAVAFVLSANLHRRHMSAGQQAAIVASATDWAKAHKHGGDRKSDQAEVLPLDTVRQRAATAGTTERTQRDADRLAREHPEKALEVAQGKTSLHKAVKQTRDAFAPPTTSTGPKVSPDADDFGPSAEEIAEAERAASDDAEAVRLLLESDDKLSEVFGRCKQQAALIRTLESRIAGMQAELAEARSLAKSWRTKFEKLQKVNA